MTNAFESLKTKWDYDGNSIVHDLITIADYYRFALSQFLKYPLTFGHSTVSAQEDATLLILHFLKLPIEDGIEHWGACRLTKYEREKLSVLIGRRIVERLPVAYLLNSCYQQGELFYVDNRERYCTRIPTTINSCENHSNRHSKILTTQPNYNTTTISPPVDINDVLDLCTGSGCLAVLAARQFMAGGIASSAVPARQRRNRRSRPLRIDAVDISRDALSVAEVNINNKNLQSVISLYLGNLYSALPALKSGSHPSRVRQYDLIICNPPYVMSSLIKSLPKEYLHEPTTLALDGGVDGLKVVEQVLRGAFAHLKENGGLILEVGTGKDALIRLFPNLFEDEDISASSSTSSAKRVLWLATSNSEDEVCFIPKQYLAAQYLE
eukprot:gene22389-30640_t